MPTIQDILARKGQCFLSVLTAYDYPTARLLDEASVDMLLVGDSLGMVVLGFPDTTHVTLDHMVHHVAAVKRGTSKALIIGDMPIHTYDTPEEAVKTAQVLVKAGADVVKLEGGIAQLEKIKAIIATGIPVMGHLGMLPQSVLEEGGYKKKGKSQEEITRLHADAKALSDAGVVAIVLESVVTNVASDITKFISVPTIGIGCGKGTCDGEVAVVTDLVGSFPWFVPPFATPKANISVEITRAAQEWLAEQRSFRR